MTNRMWTAIGRTAWLLCAAVWAFLWLAGAAHAQYRIGAEDVLHIAVLGNKDLEMDVTVQPDGRITFPMAGEVVAAGKTVTQVSTELTQKIRALIRDAVVGVTVKEVNSYKLFLVGAVLRPGTYRARSEMTLLQLLSLGGGPMPGAELTQVYIVRKDQKIAVNAKKLLDEGDASQNPVLLADDTVVVPGSPRPGVVAGPAARAAVPSVYVLGQVNRPGPVPIAGELKVVQALAMAGGFTPFASPSRVLVIREEGAKRVTLPVDVNAILKGEAAQDVLLQVGDVIHVPETFF
jgi:polysaccharide export outer membrane protein